MYATSGGAPAGSTKVLQTENPYFDASEQMPKNTKQLRAQKLIPKKTEATAFRENANELAATKERRKP